MKNKTFKLILFLLPILIPATTAFSQEQGSLKTFAVQEAFEKNGVVRINSSGRKLEIKIWQQNAVKVEYSLPDAFTKGMDEKNWLEKMGIKLTKSGNTIDITTTGGLSYTFIKPEGNETKGTEKSDRRADLERAGPRPLKANNDQLNANSKIIIYVPESSSVEIVNKSSSLIISGKLIKGNFNLTNTNLDASEIIDLKIAAGYCTLHFETIGVCVADISNSTFRAGAIDKFEIKSTRSSVEYDKGNTISIRSDLDNGYTVDEVDVAEGRLVYSNIRIEKLNKRLDFEGNNYDVKVRQINPGVELVKINNSFGDLRLPVKGVTNYKVKFEGKFCSVIAPFEIIPVRNDKEKGGNQKDATNNNPSSNAPPFFTASAGSAVGKYTLFEIVCQQCSVDFK